MIKSVELISRKIRNSHGGAIWQSIKFPREMSQIDNIIWKTEKA